jgi:hypothetical protein
MRKGIWSLAVAVVLVSSLTVVGCSKKKDSDSATEKKPAAASVNMNEGQWEITTTMDMPGMPAMAKKPHTVTTCLTKSDYVPKASHEKSDCKMVDQKIDGNTVSWNMVCKESSGKGTVTYAGDSYSGLMESTVKAEGKEMTVKMKMDGKRIGACPQK